MGALVGGNDVRIQRAGLVEPPERPVHGGVTDRVEPPFPQPPDDVISIAVFFAEHREHGQVQHALQELGVVDLNPLHLRIGWYYGLRTSANSI